MMMMSNAGHFEQNPYGEEVDYSMTNKNVHSLELQHHLMEQNNDGYDEPLPVKGDADDGEGGEGRR